MEWSFAVRIWIKRHRVLLLCLMSLQGVFLLVSTMSVLKMLEREPVNPINFVRIHSGMTLKEVQAIIGAEEFAITTTTSSAMHVVWINWHFCISVTFDQRGTVSTKTIGPSPFVQQDPLRFFITFR
jgi:hypothetical protein